MKNTISLLDYGQSYWLDNLTREKIINGEIKDRVTEQGLRGITSNPSIFNKAFTSGNEYDSQIEKLAKEGKSSQEIYEALTVTDVQNACDILLPVFDSSKGTDGFVSLEVSPYLARDTEGSMIEARKLYKAVNRANCYIKIPGTLEGVPAIEEMLYEGININITLLFSIENYEAVAQAYIRALKRRMKEGKSLSNIVSVASFFLSRIDVLVDQLLSHRIIPSNSLDKNLHPELLMGKAAIASAKLAYQCFKKTFQGKDWKELVEKGANVQRVLWASTSTKNKLYKDVLYVDSLIGDNTVNTLPEETIKDFNDHGTLKKDAIEENIEEAKKVFSQLEKLHINLKFVTQQLENEGIQKFIESYNTLIEGLEAKRIKALEGKIPKQEINSAALDVKPIYTSLDELQFGKRLFKQDSYLWRKDKKQVNTISERLGWLNLTQDSIKKLDKLSLTGIDIVAMHQSALRMQTSCDPTIPASKNVGIALGVVLGVSSNAGRDKVTFVLSKSLKPFGLWLEQLLVEKGKGLIPIQEEAFGAPEVYANDRIFVHISLISDNNSDDIKKLDLLEKAGHPIVRIGLNDKSDLGGEFYRWEVAIASAEMVIMIKDNKK